MEGRKQQHQQQHRDELEEYWERGREALRRRKYRRAEELLVKAVGKFHPDSHPPQRLAMVLCSRAYARNALHRHQEALSDAEQAIQQDPHCSIAYSRKAEALLSLGQRAEALHSYEASLEREQDEMKKDRLSMRIIELHQMDEAEREQLYFRQLIPGRDICLSTFNPIKKLIFEAARGMQNIIYVVGDRRSGECLVVDACWDTDTIVRLMEMEHLRPVGFLVTHNHFDHVGGRPPPFRHYGITVQGVRNLLDKYPTVPLLVHQDDADALQGETGISPDRIQTTVDGQVLMLGGRISVRFLHTPGHTPGSQCIQIGEGRLLSGDTLFPSSCGRMDLPGGSSRTMYETLQNRLTARLPPETIIYPGHSYGGWTLSTLERERRCGMMRPMSLEEWYQLIGVTSGAQNTCRS